MKCTSNELSQHSRFHSLYLSFSMGGRDVAFLSMSNTFALPPSFLQTVPFCKNPSMISRIFRIGNGHNHLNSSFTSLESSGLGFNSPASRSDLESYGFFFISSEGNDLHTFNEISRIHPFTCGWVWGLFFVVCCASVLIQLVTDLHNSLTILKIREWTRKSTNCGIIPRETLQKIREKWLLRARRSIETCNKFLVIETVTFFHKPSEDEILPSGYIYSIWLVMPKSQQSWVRSLHPPTQWNLRGVRRRRVKSDISKPKKSPY